MIIHFTLYWYVG